ncbi:folic acid synthesis [Lecanosticta acicola]|uniref:Folic acid synthesis protein FOL1 n=1 Tax=Lecanosticta acicola TaxID=111012 RepID=A0AAI8Z1N5_9PEZI|nr:folic acid synthesis [Lecanosticta acicola]
MNVSSARLSITLHGVCIDDGRASQESALSRLDRICELLEPHLADMFRASKSLTLQEAAHECCRIVANLPQPIDGTLQPKMVKAKLDLQAPDDNNAATSATSSHNVSQGASKDVVFVALGSNIGDRCGVLESACKMIDASADMQILRTSPLYETEPMYVEEQESFLNGVCMISTSLAPNELLDRLQAIENDLGRVKLVDKGPRNIDLDIVAYKGEVVNTERLIIPHRLMTEREFVLRPLRDVDDGSFEHPVTGKSVEQLLRAYGRPPDSFTPIAPGCDAIHANNPKRRTRVMAILNVTPDSFSDGGDNQPADVESLKATALSHIAAGATIIDIGGQSSRPNAPDITAEEELARVLPAIEAIKSLPEAANIAISIDTYRASVAEAAINAGAHIVNDISAGLLDPEMFPTVARLGCTYIMTHMRGTPSTMQDAEHTTYTSGLLHGIYTELQDRIEEAQQAGIRRWRIILDPGIGFSKTTGQNLQILRALNSLKKKQSRDTTGYPWLVGSSRKGFIGKVTGAEDAKDRVFGTAATVTAAIQGGADIVRVHDVKEMVQVARMADAIYRRLPGEESWPEEPSGDGNQQ